jgi:hypothetical protein
MLGFNEFHARNAGTGAFNPGGRVRDVVVGHRRQRRGGRSDNLYAGRRAGHADAAPTGTKPRTAVISDMATDLPWMPVMTSFPHEPEVFHILRTEAWFP